ncbi:hypothetical protein [Streptomyces iconiensis]|uniref:HNH endonuclease n=1 Tax=Streptomyces iconiensis TaxID=1384038 RepID=A0ABT7A2F1_9ACTN|nr:hypothetical protein [Streptomyces iconiensis]MDJ1135026.1 hypothetical protein [Streptomyces iconiensis]
METATTPTPFPRWPEGIPGCARCEKYTKERERRYHRREYSEATDQNVYLVRLKQRDHAEEDDG